MTVVEVLDACSNHLGAHIGQDKATGLWSWKLGSLVSSLGHSSREEAERHLQGVRRADNGNLVMKLGPDPGVDQV